MVIVDIQLHTIRFQKWRYLRGIVSGLREGATIGLRFPESVNIENARGAITSFASVYRLFDDYDVKRDRENNILWVTRVQHSQPNRVHQWDTDKYRI